MPQMFMAEDIEVAKTRTLEELGDISEVHVDMNKVLVAVYERPEKTASGLYLSDKTRKEDVHQGKAALVVKIGPGVDQTDRNVDFCGRKLKVGEWVVIWPADGKKLVLNDKACRVVRDDLIDTRIPRPDMVW